MGDSDDSMEKLRAVFDVCDEKKEGFISVQHFASLAKDHFEGGEEIVGVIQLLDPDGTGKINFDDFCEGVQQILDIQGNQSLPITSLKLNNNYNSNRELTVVPEEDTNSNGTQEASEISTYNEYDMMTDDDVGPLVNIDTVSSSTPLENNHSFFTPNQDLLDLLSPNQDTTEPFQQNQETQGRDDISQLLQPNSDLSQLSIHNRPNSSEDDHDSAISGKSLENPDQRNDQDLSEEEEEQFEDYGEGEVEESGDEIKDISGHARPLQSEHTKKSTRHHQREKREQRQKRLSCPSRRLSSNAHATSLMHNSGSSNTSEGIFDDIDGNFTELNDKVKFLETQIALLSESQHKTDDRHLKLRDENTSLRDRVHVLEEQLREVESKAEEKLEEEQKRHREMMSRHDRDRSIEIESLNLRLQHIEKEYNEAKEEAPRLRVELERLRREKEDLENQLSDSQDAYALLHDDYQKLQERAKISEEEYEQERNANSQLIDELTREVDDLKAYKADIENSQGSRTPGGSQIGAVFELKQQVENLKSENKGLREANEDLHASLMQKSVEEGRSLLNGAKGGAESLAAEFEQLSKDELMDALKEQQEVNAKLREYVDRIILTIIDSNPSILEIKSAHK